jgi:hypothetical protein
MPIVARLMKRRTKMDKKGVSNAPSALAVVGTESDEHGGRYKKTGTYRGKAAYINGDGGAIWYDKELNGGSWVLGDVSSIGSAACRVLVASTLLFTASGVHRLLGPCEGRQSWRRPNDTQSATSNCNTHDPVTRSTLHAAPGSPTHTHGL